MNIAITIRDGATPAVNRVQAFLDSDGARALMGRAASNVVRDHLQELDDTRPNKLGGERTNYYGSARAKTSYAIDPDGATVSIAQVGMRLHYYGGTVVPVTKKFLTIPATAEAYGKSAASFDLVLVWGLNGPYALAKAITSESMTERNGYRQSRKAGEIMFYLKESVTMQPDETVLPEGGDIAGEIKDRLGSAIRRRFKGLDLEEEGGGDE
jgi:hypothetical protein